MNNFDDDIKHHILLLQQKQEASGQQFPDFIEGLINTRNTNYWEYINLDALLNLQHPKTDLPDEMIFITYHQICELYFKLMLHELQMISGMEKDDADFMISRLKRIIRYFEHLVNTFDIVLKGIDYSQFQKFRQALFPASAYQSVQYRLIEFFCTDLCNLIHPSLRSAATAEPVRTQFKKIYWLHMGNRQHKDGPAPATVSFLKNYEDLLLRKADELKHTNVNSIFNRFFVGDAQRDLVIPYLKELDLLANVEWPLAHFKAAAFHLKNGQGVSRPGTGGSDWKKYLPPHFQKIFYFPELWTSEEKENWGSLPGKNKIPVTE